MAASELPPAETCQRPGVPAHIGRAGTPSPLDGEDPMPRHTNTRSKSRAARRRHRRREHAQFEKAATKRQKKEKTR
jgi:hypothetical protein